MMSEKKGRRAKIVCTLGGSGLALTGAAPLMPSGSHAVWFRGTCAGALVSIEPSRSRPAGRMVGICPRGWDRHWSCA